MIVGTFLILTDITFQVKLDHTPAHAFGIKHSPYLGHLKGDAWVSPRTEVESPPLKSMTNGDSYSSSAAAASSDTRISSQTTKGASSTTTTTRTHSDGTKIRTETFTYVKGPTTTTRVTTQNNYKREQTAIA